MKLTYAQIAQAIVFCVVVISFVGFGMGFVHVPSAAEDAKFFYMLFGIINTILAVPVLVNAVQKDDGYIASEVPVSATELVEPKSEDGQPTV